MNRIGSLFLIINFLLVSAVIGFLFLQKGESKMAFIYSQKVFQEYKGTRYLMTKLSQETSKQKKELDSLGLLIRNGRNDLRVLYETSSRDFSTYQEQLSERYTADIWRRINEDIRNYGEENNFDYILGASGNGSLMYSREVNDITGEVIKYLNSKYEGD